MESNKKRKLAARVPNEPKEGRNKYHKKLRREQKKRWKRRKKGLEPQRQELPLEGDVERPKNGEIDMDVQEKPTVLPRGLPRGKLMVSAALKNTMQSRAAQKTQLQMKHVVSPSKPKTPKGDNSIGMREIKLSSLKRDVGRRAIGSGTFGACYLAEYRGIAVVVKEFKERKHTTKEKLRTEAAYEARVIQGLGDHPGIPLLLGVMIRQPIVGIIVQFHGDSNESVTIYKAAKEKIIKKQNVWNQVLGDVADALEHVHSRGFIHNDLKSNNVVLETKEGRQSPVIIDFGKSVLAARAKKPLAKLPHIREHYKNTYIAPELIDGTGKPSVCSDVYSLAYMIKSVFKLLKFNINTTTKNALANDPEIRPSVTALKESLSAK